MTLKKKHKMKKTRQKKIIQMNKIKMKINIVSQGLNLILICNSL